MLIGNLRKFRSLNFLVLGGFLVSTIGQLGCGGELGLEDEQDPFGGTDEELMQAAYDELLATEGKADGATCSGVRPPDRGPFNNRIALTFDDGPHLTLTPRVLDVLAAHNAVGTFFIAGNQVRTQAHRDLLRRIIAEGHIVANHSQNHVNSVRVSSSTWEQEVRETDRILRNIMAEFGQEPTFFRFPYGSANCNTYNTVTSMAYTVVGWHIDTADWCFANSRGGVGHCSPATFAHVPESLRNDFAGFSLMQAQRNGGGILLMHDNQTYAVNQLDGLLTRLGNAGFTFTGLDDVHTFPLLNKETVVTKVSWIGDTCIDDSECSFSSNGLRGYCHTIQDSVSQTVQGVCSLPCDGYCPDMHGKAGTFCVESPDQGQGMCASISGPINNYCNAIPGTESQTAQRFVMHSNAPVTERQVCYPNSVGEIDDPDEIDDPIDIALTGSLVGIVFSNDGTQSRLPGALVWTSSGQQATSDSSGVYRMQEVPVGEVSVYASAQGHLASTVTITVLEDELVWGSMSLATTDKALDEWMIETLTPSSGTYAQPNPEFAWENLPTHYAAENSFGYRVVVLSSDRLNVFEAEARGATGGITRSSFNLSLNSGKWFWVVLAINNDGTLLASSELQEFHVQ